MVKVTFNEKISVAGDPGDKLTSLVSGKIHDLEKQIKEILNREEVIVSRIVCSNELYANLQELNPYDWDKIFTIPLKINLLLNRKTQESKEIDVDVRLRVSPSFIEQSGEVPAGYDYLLLNKENSVIKKGTTDVGKQSEASETARAVEDSPVQQGTAGENNPEEVG